MEHAKLLIMTVMLTAVIWTTADRMVNESATIGATIQVLPPFGTDDVLVDTLQSRPKVQLKVAGPRRVIGELLAVAPVEIKIRMTEGRTGKVAVPLLEVIEEQWTAFPKLSLVSVSPPDLVITVDRRVTTEVPILLRPVNVPCDVAPKLSQPFTRLRIRESVLAGRKTEDLPSIDITADVERLLRDQPVGRPITFAVPLSMRAYGPDAILEPAVMEVTATITAQQRTATLPTVPILLAVSFPNMGWPVQAVTRDDEGERLRLMTRSVSVTGPREAIDKLLRKETRVYGIVQLKQQDLQSPGTWQTVVPDFYLPPHVVLAEPPEPVEFVLRSVENAD